MSSQVTNQSEIEIGLHTACAACEACAVSRSAHGTRSTHAIFLFSLPRELFSSSSIYLDEERYAGSVFKRVPDYISHGFNGLCKMIDVCVQKTVKFHSFWEFVAGSSPDYSVQHHGISGVAQDVARMTQGLLKYGKTYADDPHISRTPPRSNQTHSCPFRQKHRKDTQK